MGRSGSDRPGKPMTQKASCTCFILVKDAAGTIARSLDSALQSGCFESILVVLDSRSTDSTGRIVQGYIDGYTQVRRALYGWTDPPDFAAARNYALSLIRTDYAFWLDADEVIKDAAALRGLLSRPGPAAYLMWVDSPMLHGAHNMYQPRLVPALPGVAFECEVFERIDWSLARAGVPMLSTNLRIISHDGYMDSGTLKRKNLRNRAILLRWIRRKSRSWIRPAQIRTVQDRHMREQLRRLS